MKISLGLDWPSFGLGVFASIVVAMLALVLFG